VAGFDSALMKCHIRATLTSLQLVFCQLWMWINIQQTIRFVNTAKVRQMRYCKSLFTVEIYVIKKTTNHLECKYYCDIISQCSQCRTN